MDDSIANLIFSSLLRQLMTQNKVYKVHVVLETGEHEFNLILDEENQINVYDNHQIGTA